MDQSWIKAKVEDYYLEIIFPPLFPFGDKSHLNIVWMNIVWKVSNSIFELGKVKVSRYIILGVLHLYYFNICKYHVVLDPKYFENTIVLWGLP